MSWWVLAVPSCLVAYMMICQLNDRKRRFWSAEGWAYLLFLGGSVFSLVSILQGRGLLLGELMLNFGLLCYFVARSWRVKRWLKRHRVGVDGKH